MSRTSQIKRSYWGRVLRHLNPSRFRSNEVMNGATSRGWLVRDKHTARTSTPHRLKAPPHRNVNAQVDIAPIYYSRSSTPLVDTCYPHASTPVGASSRLFQSSALVHASAPVHNSQSAPTCCSILGCPDVPPAQCIRRLLDCTSLYPNKSLCTASILTASYSFALLSTAIPIPIPTPTTLGLTPSPGTWR